MSDLIAITDKEPQIPSLISMVKTISLEDSGKDLETTDNDKKERVEDTNIIFSQRNIKVNSNKEKYASILKTQYKNNDFRSTSYSPQKQTSKEENNKSYAVTLRNLERKRYKPSGIIVLPKTQYPIIHNLIHKYFCYKFYNKEDHFNDIFLIWIDTYVSEQFVKRLKSYQKINHFPNSCQIGRKDLLSNNLKQASKVMPQQYNFYPKTWILPKESDSFAKQRPHDKFLIVKPHANCQGRGIFLSKSPIFNPKDEVIVQQYIQNPMLIDSCKFDLRIYVLLRSLNPLRIYVYKEGLCRLATSKYSVPTENNIRNDKMHLTNYAINKMDPNFVGNKDIYNDDKGHKRSYTSAIRDLKQQGYDTDKIEERIDSIIVRTILAAYPKMFRSYKKARSCNTQYLSTKDSHSPIKDDIFSKPISDHNSQQPSVCFQLLGFDIMLLDTGQPILLEINHQPSLIADSPFDMTVKKSLIMDTINILNIEEKDKEEWERCQREGVVFKNKIIEEKQIQNMGAYRRIYPLSHVKVQNTIQAERIENTKLFYETIFNKFMSRQTKLSNKIKITNSYYKTIGSKVQCRNSKRIQSADQKQADLPPYHSNRAKSNKTVHGQSENHKAVALTFYNLFNDAKYHIKKGGQFPRNDNEEFSPDDRFLRNQIYLAEVDQDYKIPQKQPRKVASKVSYDSPSLSDRLNIKLQKEERQLNLLSKLYNTDQQESKDQIQASALTCYNKFRQNFTSIRNRGLISYITSHKQKRRTRLNGGSVQDANYHFKQSSSQKMTKNQFLNSIRQKHLNSTKKQDWRGMMVTSSAAHTSHRQSKEDKQRTVEVGSLYNAPQENVEKINSVKAASQYQKLNFASFLDKNKVNKKRSNCPDEECSEFKQTSPSNQ